MSRILNRLNRRYPQNFIIKYPFQGSLLFMLFCFIFILLYNPLKVQASQHFGFPVTMAVYSFVSSLTIFVFIHFLKLITCFSNKKDWTFVKEIVSVLLILSVMGIVIYFLGFIMENPEIRWNLDTFLNSCKIAFLLGIIPFGLFTFLNYRHLFINEVSQNFNTENNPQPEKEEKLKIISKLKKEELAFYPSQLLYAEADGNYVIFYLEDKEQKRKEMVRNSISDIEKQLLKIKYFTRTHRAFIVNVKKISSKKGNTLGYRLKLSGVDAEIPVSRQKVTSFDMLLNQYK